MKQAGQIVLFRFPQTDLEAGKLRPALLLGRLPGEYNDWLICMISSQTRHCIAGFDELVREEDADFAASGLKSEGILRAFLSITLPGHTGCIRLLSTPGAVRRCNNVLIK
jgi:mRNA interferase MazF